MLLDGVLCTLDDSGHVFNFITFGLVWGLRPKKHKVNTYKERALSTVCTNGKMETKREIASKNELVPMPEFRIRGLPFIFRD